VLLQLACKDNGAGPLPPAKDPRTYTFTLDTLAYPNAGQTSMYDIARTAANNVFTVGHNSSSRAGTMYRFDGKTRETTDYTRKEEGSFVDGLPNEEKSFLSRFSFEVGLKYSNSPWKNYNAYMESQVRRYEYLPDYSDARGSWDKVNGDHTYNGVISFEVIPKFSFLLGYDLTTINPNTQYEYDDQGFIRYTTRRIENWKSQIHGIGAGIRYLTALSPRSNIFLSLDVKRYRTNLDLDWARVDYFNGEWRFERRIGANLSANTVGWNVVIGADWALVDFISLVAEVSYRRIKFDDLKGTASYSSFANDYAGEHFDYVVRLTNNPDYFGVSAVEANGLSYLLPAQDRYVDSPSRGLDLSGVGISIGLKISF
jgi:hypothetical protein